MDKLLIIFKSITAVVDTVKELVSLYKEGVKNVEVKKIYKDKLSRSNDKLDRLRKRNAEQRQRRKTTK